MTHRPHLVKIPIELVSSLLLALFWGISAEGLTAPAIDTVAKFGDHTAQSPDTTAVDETQLRRLTVRVVSSDAAGSGAIVDRSNDTYTVLTNWHVVENRQNLTVLTHDGHRHSLSVAPRRIAGVDMAVVRFRSSRQYPVVPLAENLPQVGETAYAAGFPLYERGGGSMTIDRGITNFTLNVGEVSVLLDRPLLGGYQLGYTNPVVVGMSGGPIFNGRGELIGLNARTSGRDPGFGAYQYRDGSSPTPDELEIVQSSSLGVPIHHYTGLSPVSSTPTVSPPPRNPETIAPPVVRPQTSLTPVSREPQTVRDEDLNSLQE